MVFAQQSCLHHRSQTRFERSDHTPILRFIAPPIVVVMAHPNINEKKYRRNLLQLLSDSLRLPHRGRMAETVKPKLRTNYHSIKTWSDLLLSAPPNKQHQPIVDPSKGKISTFFRTPPETHFLALSRVFSLNTNAPKKFGSGSNPTD